MKLYAIKFSNGLYVINPYFAYGDHSVDGTLTDSLNCARLVDDYETAKRHAESALDRRELLHHVDSAIAGCSYEIVEVQVVEVY